MRPRAEFPCSLTYVKLITPPQALLIAPFPGLQQLAVFAAAGLSAACITVICWYPRLSRRLPVRPAPGLTLILRWLHAWRHRPALRYGLPGAVLLLVIVGFSQLLSLIHI